MVGTVFKASNTLYTKYSGFSILKRGYNVFILKIEFSCIENRVVSLTSGLKMEGKGGGGKALYRKLQNASFTLKTLGVHAYG